MNRSRPDWVSSQHTAATEAERAHTFKLRERYSSTGSKRSLSGQGFAVSRFRGSVSSCELEPGCFPASRRVGGGDRFDHAFGDEL